MNKSDIESKVKLAEEISKEVDPDLKETAFKEVLNFFLWHDIEEQPPVKNIQYSAEPLVMKDKVSLPEILSTIKPKSYTDKAMITSYFIFKYEEIDTFNANQVGDRLTKARVTKPSNMTDTLNGLIKRGFLREGPQVEGNKGFELTEKGKEYAESLLATTEDT